MPNQYHILQFSDSHGVPTYACCLTVTSIIRLSPTNSQHKRIVSNLTPLQKRVRARQVIIRFFRYAHTVTLARQKVIVNKDGVVVGYIRPRSLSAHSAPSISKSSPNSPLSFRKLKNSVIHRLGGRASVTRGSEEGDRSLPRSGSCDEVQGGNTSNGTLTNDLGSQSENRALYDNSKEVLEMSPQTGFARAISFSRDARDDDSEAMSETSDDDSAVWDSHSTPPSGSPMIQPGRRSSPISKKKPKMKRPRKRTQSRDEEKDVSHYLVSQRAYVLLSAKPLHTFLFRVRHHTR